MRSRRERLVRKGGSIKFGGYVFQSDDLENRVCEHVFVDDSSPRDALYIYPRGAGRDFLTVIHDSPGKRSLGEMCEKFTFRCPGCNETFCVINGTADDCPDCTVDSIGG